MRAGELRAMNAQLETLQEELKVMRGELAAERLERAEAQRTFDQTLVDFEDTRRIQQEQVEHVRAIMTAQLTTMRGFKREAETILVDLHKGEIDVTVAVERELANASGAGAQACAVLEEYGASEPWTLPTCISAFV